MAAFLIYPPPVPHWTRPSQAPLARAWSTPGENGLSRTHLEVAQGLAHSSYELHSRHDLMTRMPHRANEAIQYGDLSSALALIDETFSNVVGNPSALVQFYNRRAFILCRMRRFRDAAETIEMVLRIFEREGLEARPADYYERSLIRYRQHQLDEALDDINTALRIVRQKRLRPPHNYLFHQALLYSNVQNYYEAHAAIFLAIDAKGDHAPPRYYSLAAKILRNCDCPEKALDMINRAIVKERQHPFPETHFERSRILVALERYEDALHEIEFTLDLESKKPLPKTLRQKAYILGCLDRWKEAEAIILRLIRREGAIPSPQTSKEWLRINAALMR